MGPPEGERVGLSPEEEHAFAAIVYELGGGRHREIPWKLVAISVLVVVVFGVLAGFLLGLPAPALILFSATFAVGLSAGLLVISQRDRRSRRH